MKPGEVSNIMTPEELKAFSANIKNLPPGERKAAGLKFKEMLSLVVAAPKATEIVKKRGKELWSYNRGQPNEIVGYKKCVVTPVGTVWGFNLKFVPRK